MGSGILTGTLLAMCISFGLWQGSVWAAVFCFSLVVAGLQVALEVLRLAARSCEADLRDDT